MSELCVKTKSGQNGNPCTTLLDSIRAEVLKPIRFPVTLKSGERISRVGVCTPKFKSKHAFF